VGDHERNCATRQASIPPGFCAGFVPGVFLAFFLRFSWRFLVFGFGIRAHVDYRCAISCKLDTLVISN
jgi:hypothetical protein